MNERSESLSDEAFWNRLEYSVSGWLSTSAEKEMRRFWIDGFLPQGIRNTTRGVDVIGLAWVCYDAGNRGMDGGYFVSDRRYSYHFASVPNKMLTRGENTYPIDCVVSVPQKMLKRRGGNYVIEDVSINPSKKSIQIILNVAK